VSDRQRADERCFRGRRSRVVLTPRRWRQVFGGMSAQPGADTPYLRATVTTSRSPRRARRKPLKPLRAGMPGDSGATVVTTLVCFLHFAREAAGALGARHSPRPRFSGRRIHAQLGRVAPRDCEGVSCRGCLKFSEVVITRHPVRPSAGRMTGSSG